ncbi:hypothetical protein IAQ61_002113, partial [Plenodomus lingam]
FTSAMCPEDAPLTTIRTSRETFENTHRAEFRMLGHEAFAHDVNTVTYDFHIQLAASGRHSTFGLAFQQQLRRSTTSKSRNARSIVATADNFHDFFGISERRYSHNVQWLCPVVTVVVKAKLSNTSPRSSATPTPENLAAGGRRQIIPAINNHMLISYSRISQHPQLFRMQHISSFPSCTRGFEERGPIACPHCVKVPERLFTPSTAITSSTAATSTSFNIRRTIRVSVVKVVPGSYAFRAGAVGRAIFEPWGEAVFLYKIWKSRFMAETADADLYLWLGYDNLTVVSDRRWSRVGQHRAERCYKL